DKPLDRVRVAWCLAALVPTRRLSLLDGQPVADRAGDFDAASAQHRDVSPDGTYGRYRRPDQLFALVDSAQLGARSGAVRGSLRAARIDRRSVVFSWRRARVRRCRAATSTLFPARSRTRLRKGNARARTYSLLSMVGPTIHN